MNKISKIAKYISNKDYRFIINAHKGKYNSMPDDAYLKRLFLATVGYPLNLDNPLTFNEKIQWLKLYDHNPLYPIMVDKHEAKKYVGDLVGTQYIIPTIGVWNNYDEINFDSLPGQFVLKCTHDSGGLVIVRDKNNFDKRAAQKKINKSLKLNYYLQGREWAYKNVQPRIIAEKYMSNHDFPETGKNKYVTEGLFDYKLMCFNGHVKCSFVCSERNSPSGLKVTFFDKEWNIMPFERHYPRSLSDIPKPECYDQMVLLAEKISRNLPFARIDFYEIDGKIYFGEITLYPGNGFEEFTPIEWDYRLGNWLDLKRNIK